ncbi:MAG: hypothetical protein NZ934_04820, partial [Hadesarchaea archaeon]|nr:hypothetical protein [Hadesarchaea archaeon]
MGNIYYQTLEAVAPEELEILRRLKEDYNAGCRSSRERIKLWRKGDILTCMEPLEARWGFSWAGDGGKGRVLEALQRMSVATPRLTWVIFDEDRRAEIA